MARERLIIEREEGDTRNPAAVLLGSLGCSKGGLARAAKLSPGRRSEISALGQAVKVARRAAFLVAHGLEAPGPSAPALDPSEDEELSGRASAAGVVVRPSKRGLKGVSSPESALLEAAQRDGLLGDVDPWAEPRADEHKDDESV